MPELEEQLRELGTASSLAARRPDADAWSDVRDRLGEPVVSVVPIVSGGRSRGGRLMAVAAVVAAIALAGASLVAGSHRGADRVVGGELSGSSRWLPVPAPDGFRPNRASDNMPDGPIAGRIIVVRSTVGDLTAITLYSQDGPTDPTSGGLTAALVVRGFPAVLQPFDDDTTSLEWSDTVVTYQLIVAGARATDRAFLLDIASRVTRPGPTSADVALESVPDGFDVRFVGSEDRLRPGGGWKLGYEADDGRSFQVELTVGGLTAEQLAAIYDYEPVTVAGRSGYLGVGGPGAFPVAGPAHRTLLIDLTNGVHLVLNSLDLTTQELLDIGASLRPVDDDSWHTVADGAPESYLNAATTSAQPNPPSSERGVTVTPTASVVSATAAETTADANPSTVPYPLGRFDGLPFGQPACSPPSPMVGSEIRGTAATGELWGLLFAKSVRVGQEIKIVWRMTGSGDLAASATAPSGVAVEPFWGPALHTGSNWGRPGDEWGTGFIFTEPGCWHLRLTRSQSVADVWLLVDG